MIIDEVDDSFVLTLTRFDNRYAADGAAKRYFASKNRRWPTACRPVWEVPRRPGKNKRKHRIRYK
jgi:hypothetical protein